jgi:hypothetical protein
VLDIPGVWNLLDIKVLYVIRSRSCNLVHEKGSLPSRIKLVQPGFVLDAMKDNISNVERMLLNIPVMVTMELLKVAG